MNDLDEKTRWIAVRSILERTGPFQRQGFEPSTDTFNMIREVVKVLVIGAGGLGCELLKDLALLGFRQLHIIDMDTIDVSNLNRQFLFRRSDVGKPKAEVAARFVQSRVAGCEITPHVSRIEDMPESFYKDFHVVVCGLDSITARRWINNLLASMVQFDEDSGAVDPNSVIPLVDGGTEGFKGNARVVLHTVTPCVECQLALYPPQVNFPLCTLAHTPRLPEHCIEYVRLLLWPQEQPFGNNISIDGDNAEHIQWIMRKSQIRAQEYGIEGITYRLTQGVVKRIIPAVASTNAVISAACSMEVFKLVTFCHDYLNNYLNFTDSEGVYAYSFAGERKEDCLSCSNVPQKMTFRPTDTLRDVLTFLKESPALQMRNPSITTVSEQGNRTLYLNIRGMEASCVRNLRLSLWDLQLRDGQRIYVADSTRPKTLEFILHLNTSNTGEESGLNQG